MNQDFINALHEIEKEKGVSVDIIYEALESALISSYKKKLWRISKCCGRNE